MSKPVLTLPHNYKEGESWNLTLFRMLARSDLWEIAEEVFPVAPRISGNRRGSNFTLFRVNGILCGLDTWDDNNPSALYYNAKCFSPTGYVMPEGSPAGAKGDGNGGGPFKDVKIIFKIQYLNNSFWPAFTKETGIKVTPWTVMPSRVFPMEFFKWSDRQHKYLVSTTGRNCRFGRTPWVEHCKKRGDCYVPEQHINHKDDMEFYKQILQDVRWGLVLRGLPRSDGKNRRESEFGSCGIPLILNYKPTYPFEFEAGKQFLYMTKPEELDTLKDIDPRPYSEAITQVYHDHFSPIGMSLTLMDLIRKLT